MLLSDVQHSDSDIDRQIDVDKSSFSDFFPYVVVESLSHVQLFCDSMDSSLPGSFVHGISQAKILEWVAISFSRGSSQPITK